jgi:hypothetical protein
MVREEVSKITSVSVVGVSLFIATPSLKETVAASSSNADEWMSMAWAFQGIERVTGVHHTTVIAWVKQVGKHLPDTDDPEAVPQVGKLHVVCCGTATA